MGYATGDTVVHPRHGVGTVRGMTSRGTGKSKTDYLELFFELKTLTIMVPLDSVDEVGLRPPASKDEAKSILAILEEDSEVPEVWAERNAESMSRMDSTDLAQAAMVIRDLTRHSDRIEKPLSSAENSTLEACLETVSLELSLALDMTQDQTKALILQKVGMGDEVSDSDEVEAAAE